MRTDELDETQSVDGSDSRGLEQTNAPVEPGPEPAADDATAGDTSPDVSEQAEDLLLHLP